MPPQAGYTVGTTRVLVSAGSVRNNWVVVANIGTVRIYLGDATVTTANGLPLEASEKVTFTREDLDAFVGKDLYAIAGTAGQDVRVLVGLS